MEAIGLFMKLRTRVARYIVVVKSAFIDQLRYNIPTSGRSFSIAVSLLFMAHLSPSYVAELPRLSRLVGGGQPVLPGDAREDAACDPGWRVL